MTSCPEIARQLAIARPHDDKYTHPIAKLPDQLVFRGRIAVADPFRDSCQFIGRERAWSSNNRLHVSYRHSPAAIKPPQ